MKPFSLARPRGLTEALTLLASEATAMAGGTDLLGLMKAGVAGPERIVDLTAVEGLHGWTHQPGGDLEIGALTLLADIESSTELRALLPILPAALSDAATPQLRAMGTIGGNLLQRTRCWYYRDDAFQCWLKGGSSCFARQGEHRIHAVVGARECISASPGDLAPALIACDASLELRSAQGARELALEDLYLAPGGDDRREHAILPGEVITRVRIPAGALARSGAFHKHMDRKAWSFALVSVAVSAHLEDRRARNVRIVLGGVAPVPWRATASERLLEGAVLDGRSAAEAGRLALEGAEPLAQNAFKVPLAAELVRRTLLALTA